MTHFLQEPKENPKKMIRRRTWPDFLSCNSTNQHANPAFSSPVNDNDYESQRGRSSTKTFTNSEATTAHLRDSSSSCPAWSVRSLMSILPDSPSPICSSPTPVLSPRSFSPSTDIFYSQVSTEFSTPRNQSSGTLSNVSKLSTSSVEIEEWIENANDFCSFYQPNLESNIPTEDEGMKQDCSPKCLTISSIYESELTAIDQEVPSVTLPSVYEEKRQCAHSRYGASDAESPMNEHHHAQITRPKPYHAFLDEIKKQEVEAQINAWKRAKHMKFMNKLRSKEAAISDWEFKQTRNAMSKLKKVERKLERKRVKALEAAQKNISRAQKKADKKKAKERRSTVEKLSRVTRISEKIQAAKSLIWLKLMRLC